MKKIIRYFAMFVLISTLMLSFIIGGNFMSKSKAGLIENKRFIPCPNSPNCVSSMADKDDQEHYIEPISYNNISEKDVYSRIIEILKNSQRCRIVTKRDNYIHAEFKSKIFRFTDDIEFLFPEGQSIIHVRSTSRVGYSDMGVNRKRMMNIKALFKEVQP